MEIVKRQKMLVFLAFSLLLSGCAGQGDDAGDAAETRFFGMDTDISITAYGGDAEKALTDAQSKVAELEKLWSVTDENSEIYAINHSQGAPVNVGEETGRILSFALDMAKQTRGALEPTIYPVLTAWGFTTRENRIPDESELEEILRDVGYGNVRLSGNEVTLPGGMELDLGAVGKGFAADEVSNVLKQAGVTSALLDLGGNIQLIGTKPDGTDWKIGLRDPFGESYIGVLSISDRAVVTSGNYERYFIGEDGKQYGHILDPATGYPAENGLASVTVVAEEGKLCDALSTSLFVMGQERATDYWRENQNFDMILLTEKGEIYLTEGLAGKFELEPDYGDVKVELIKENADRKGE